MNAARRWLPDVVALAIVLAVLAFVAWRAHGRALDPIIDTGRDLYIPEQVRGGAKLYRDILYYYPPLAAYALAAVTTFTGSSLGAYEGIGIGIALLTIAALYALVRSIGSALTAGAASLMFVACSVYSVSDRTSNYFFPYAHAATLAMLFFVCGGAFLMLYVYRGRWTIWISLALCALLAASWTKLEYAAFSLVLLLIVTIVHRLRVFWLIAYAIAGVVSLGAVSLYFADAGPGHYWLRDNVAVSSLLSGPIAKHFYRQVSGFDTPVASIAGSGFALIEIAAMLLVISGAAAILRRRGAPAALTLVAAALVIAAIAWYAGDDFFRGWSLVQLALIPFAIRRPREPMLILLVISLCATSRVFLRMTPLWYGFVFLVPLYALIAYVLFEWLPERGWYSRRMAMLWIVAAIAVCAQSLMISTAVMAQKEFAVVTPRGVFFDANRDRAEVFNDFFAHVRTRSLVVMPEGLALNYLSRTPTPLTFYTFTPIEASSPEIERQIIAEIEMRSPETIAIVSRDVSDFGYRGFGLDYDRNLAAVIRARYRIERVWRKPRFQMVLLTKRS